MTGPNKVLNFVKNKIWFSLILYLIALFITLFISEYEGVAVLLAKSLMLFVPLYIIYGVLFLIRLDYDEYKKHKRIDELLSITFCFAGILFLVFVIFQLIKAFSRTVS